MKKTSILRKLGDFVLGRGFYIALFLCVATIGASGYYLLNAFTGTPQPNQPTGGQVQVQLPDIDAVEPQVTQNDPRHQAEGLPKPATKPTPEPKPQPQTVSAPVEAPPVYTWPTKGEVFSDFSLEVLAYDETMGDWRTHSGIDIAAEVGTRVLAVSDGTVTRVYDDPLMGTSVVIDHGEGLVSTYQNLSPAPAVTKGDCVVTGTVIGAVGDTAAAEAGRPDHLHFEMTLDERPVDPVSYLPVY